MRLRASCAAIGFGALHGEDVTGTPGRIGYMLQKDLLLPQAHRGQCCASVGAPGVSRQEAARELKNYWHAWVLGKWRKLAFRAFGRHATARGFLRTSLTGTDVILLDEPFSALDAPHGEKCVSGLCPR